MINKAIFVLDSEAFLQDCPMFLPLHSYDPPAYKFASVCSYSIHQTPAQVCAYACDLLNEQCMNDFMMLC